MRLRVGHRTRLEPAVENFSDPLQWWHPWSLAWDCYLVNVLPVMSKLRQFQTKTFHTCADLSEELLRVGEAHQCCQHTPAMQSFLANGQSINQHECNSCYVQNMQHKIFQGSTECTCSSPSSLIHTGMGVPQYLDQSESKTSQQRYSVLCVTCSC